MNAQQLENIVIGIAVVGLVLYRQLLPRQVKSDRGPRLLLILGGIGLLQAVNFVKAAGSLPPIAAIATLMSLGIAAVLAFLRASSVRIWRQDDGWWRKGTPLTLVLWVLSIGSHLGIEAAAAAVDHAHAAQISGLGSATLLLYLGVSLGLQQLVLQRRTIRDSASARM
jgi:hypothetical protein